jgi:hypothetical protein
MRHFVRLGLTDNNNRQEKKYTEQAKIEKQPQVRKDGNSEL